MKLPPLGKPLSDKHLTLLTALATNCRHSIIAMLEQSQSGHPGGSLSTIDYLALLYAGILSKTGNPLIVSNGHISPAVYAILAELGYIKKKDVITGFRRYGSPFEGHVTRHVPGVWFGTGPLGAGVSAASGFALAEKLKGTNTPVYAIIGDGESQEGQVYEMMNAAHKYAIDNFIVFMDYNQVQLSDSLDAVMPINPADQWKAAGWQVIPVDGHDYAAMWKALHTAHNVKDKPVLLLANTIMGKGVPGMEADGISYQATWHGKAPTPEQAKTMRTSLAIDEQQEKLLTSFVKDIRWKPTANNTPAVGTELKNIKPGKPRRYNPDELIDCRTAYGNALLDLAKKNKSVVALTADLASSVKTSIMKAVYPDRHIDVGVAEQQMVSMAGGMSFDGLLPFCSTFGAFMTSRAKDQARVNDINEANVKMVATDCGLSVGEDGPTHQAIDDMSSMMGLFNTMVMEPADPNHCDSIIRFAATHYGNCYVRMGRHKLPILTKENGKPLYDETYVYRYGKCDRLRKGSDITIAASGSTAIEALRAWETLKDAGISAEVIIMSSPKQFAATLFTSIKKTKKLITVEDHTTASGYGASLANILYKKGITPNIFMMLGVDAYQLSGTVNELYDAAGISAKHIVKQAQRMMK